MLDLRINKKSDSGWIRVTLYKKIIIATLYGNEKKENKIGIKFSSWSFAIIDKKIRDIIEEKQNELFILDFNKEQQLTLFN